jgi:hypothetical protein
MISIQHRLYITFNFKLNIYKTANFRLVQPIYKKIAPKKLEITPPNPKFWAYPESVYPGYLYVTADFFGNFSISICFQV